MYLHEFPQSVRVPNPVLYSNLCARLQSGADGKLLVRTLAISSEVFDLKPTELSREAVSACVYRPKERNA